MSKRTYKLQAPIRFQTANIIKKRTDGKRLVGMYIDKLVEFGEQNNFDPFGTKTKT